MRKHLTFFLLLCSFLVAACGREPLYHSQSYVFGTLVDISIYGEDEARAREIANEIQQDFQRWHNQFHAWQPDSELSRLNAAFAKGEAIAVSPELADIIEGATAWYTKSKSLFNPAIGGLVNAWGFQADEFKPVRVNADKIAALVEADPKMTDLTIKDGMVSSKNPSVRLDFGGYAKGYALDRALQHLRLEGVKNALVNIGGNIIAVGRHGAKPWRVGIQHPRKPGPIATLDLEDGWAIGTSGDYQRYFERDGVRYCHIIDPRTGYPVQDMQAVTVLVPPGEQTGVISDVASKPIFIAALDDKQTVADALGIGNVMVIDGKGRIFISKQMEHRIKWIENVSPAVF
jgi:thiamine biosynthesis lipoprotein